MSSERPTGDDGRLPRLGIYLIFGAAAAVIAGSFLPWVTVNAPLLGHSSLAGTDGDGKLTLAIGAGIAVTAAVALAGYRSLWVGLVTLVLAAVAGTIATVDLIDVNERIGELRESIPADSPLGQDEGFPVDANAGAGLFVVLVGSVIALVGGFILITGHRSGLGGASPPPGLASPGSPASGESPQLPPAGPQPPGVRPGEPPGPATP
jgi:hypothetical protein